MRSLDKRFSISYFKLCWPCSLPENLVGFSKDEGSASSVSKALKFIVIATEIICMLIHHQCASFSLVIFRNVGWLNTARKLIQERVTGIIAEAGMGIRQEL